MNYSHFTGYLKYLHFLISQKTQVHNMDMFPQILLLALLLLVHCLMDCSLAFVTNTNSDRSSLLTLKSHITSDPLNLLRKNWTTKTPICNWIGITCDPRNNRVTELNISNMQLVGTIPPEIGNLSSLISLDINENSFHGPIPASLFNISSIQVINLGGNAVSSKLPIDMCKHSAQPQNAPYIFQQVVWKNTIEPGTMFKPWSTFVVQQQPCWRGAKRNWKFDTAHSIIPWAQQFNWYAHIHHSYNLFVK